MAPVRHVRAELSLELARPALPIRFAMHVLLLITAAARDITASAESTACTTTAGTGAAATAGSTTSTISTTPTSVTRHERLTRRLIGSSVTIAASVGCLSPSDGLNGKFGGLGLSLHDRIGNLLNERGAFLLRLRLRRLRF